MLDKNILDQDRGWQQIAAQTQRNVEYYKGLLIQIGETLGPIAHTDETGRVWDSVLCDTLPELVAQLVKEKGADVCADVDCASDDDPLDGTLVYNRYENTNVPVGVIRKILPFDPAEGPMFIVVGKLARVSPVFSGPLNEKVFPYTLNPPVRPAEDNDDNAFHPTV